MDIFLIFLVSIFGYAEYFLFGRGQTYRPIVMCAATGLVLGSLSEGIIIGAQMELAFIGVQEIGQTGGNFSTAITFGLPISMVVLFVQNLVYVLISPLFIKKCEEIAASGKTRLFSNLSFWGGTLLHFGPSMVLVTLTFVLGNQFANTIISAIPEFVQDGLVVASQILPAFGFAMLLEMLMKKEVIPFFFVGFLLVSYLEIPIIGIAFFGAAIVMIMYFRDEKKATSTEGAVTDDDDF